MGQSTDKGSPELEKDGGPPLAFRRGGLETPRARELQQAFDRAYETEHASTANYPRWLEAREVLRKARRELLLALYGTENVASVAGAAMESRGVMRTDGKVSRIGLDFGPSILPAEAPAAAPAPATETEKGSA